MRTLKDSTIVFWMVISDSDLIKVKEYEKTLSECTTYIEGVNHHEARRRKFMFEANYNEKYHVIKIKKESRIQYEEVVE